MLDSLTRIERLTQKIDRLLPVKPKTINWDEVWQPIPDSPQLAAYHSEADELFFGGRAGGGKSSLLVGLAATCHQESIIYRREYPQVKDLITKLKRMIGVKYGSYNSQEKLCKFIDGRSLEFGATQYEDDWEKFQGREHDYIGIDEICHFTRSLYLKLSGWLRSPIEGQRCRIVVTGNPPTSPEGEWVKEYWAPWIDPNHPNPAAPGELRWFVNDGDRSIEVDGPDPVLIGEEMVQPRSRTFIPASLDDNPYLKGSNYKSVLQALPEPLRSKLLYGDFSGGLEDQRWQVIPVAWIDAAMARWTEEHPETLDCIGVDPARGGIDRTAIARRFDYWYDLFTVPGVETPDGGAVAQLVIERYADSAEVNVDVIGVGSSPVDMLRQMSIKANPMNGSEGSKATDKSKKLGFLNKRAQWYWQFREALDPESGSKIALPKDPLLRSELAAPTWKLSSWKIQVESKDDIKDKIGRSPDRADAIIYAFANGDRPQFRPAAHSTVKRG